MLDVRSWMLDFLFSNLKPLTSNYQPRVCIIILLCVKKPVPVWSGFTTWVFHNMPGLWILDSVTNLQFFLTQ